MAASSVVEFKNRVFIGGKVAKEGQAILTKEALFGLRHPSNYVSGKYNFVK